MTDWKTVRVVLWENRLQNSVWSYEENLPLLTTMLHCSTIKHITGHFCASEKSPPPSAVTVTFLSLPLQHIYCEWLSLTKLYLGSRCSTWISRQKSRRENCMDNKALCKYHWKPTLNSFGLLYVTVRIGDYNTFNYSLTFTTFFFSKISQLFSDFHFSCVKN